MPINRDLSVSPYFDDFDEDKNFHKILFKPGVAPQVRELNQLQTILQNQIEKFGNNVYKRGTIIDGVNFIYYPNYAYVKIGDSQVDGQSSTPSQYVSNFAVDPTSNLTAQIINYADGFESTDPNLKTVYLRYINSGSTGNLTSFSAGSVLTVYDYLDSVSKIIISNGGSGFSNNDNVVFCSAIAVNVHSSNTFTVGETITQTGNTNFAVITDITTAKNKKILKIRPRTADLTNTSVSSNTWTFTPGLDIIGSTTSATATVLESVGNTASATITTTADVGKVSQIVINARGQGYYVEPYITIKASKTVSSYGARNYTDLNLIARNYIAQIKVANTIGAVGTGYAFGVTEGYIYQKGYFTKVTPQTVIVDKYENNPSNVSVGFNTIESIVDSNMDDSLLDNATGTKNKYAPGMDRLKLTPQLTVVPLSDAASNNEFFSIVDFVDGVAVRENKRTQFNSILDEVASRTSDQSGSFVTDQFLVATKSTSNALNEGSSFNIVVDPGKGYISGYRVETKSNYSIETDKGIDYKKLVNSNSTIEYGNYILVNNVAGVFDCIFGDKINLIDSAKQYINTTALVTGGVIPNIGDNIMGTARIRNLVYDSGVTGTGSAVYRLYLFNVSMNPGYTFSNIKGVRTLNNDSVADAVLTFDATLNKNVCKLLGDTVKNGLLVYAGSDSVKSLANVNYVYRSTSESVSLSNTGSASYLLTDPVEYFSYSSSTLTSDERKTVSFVPTSGDIVFTPNTASDGTANTNATSLELTNAAVINTYDVGDFVAVWNSASAYNIRRVVGKTSNALQIDSATSFTNAAASFSRAVPKNVNVPLDRLPNSSVTLSGNNKTLNINIGGRHYSSNNITSTLSFDVKVVNSPVQAKTPVRNIFVKIDLSAQGQYGPWCLGIPDIFRLKNVYLGTNSSVSTSSVEVTDQFYIDHNQNPDFYDLGYLYLKSNPDISITTSNWLLVKFDAFTSSPGVFTINSYVSSNTAQRFSDDALTLASLGNKVNSFEVPEMNDKTGTHYDLINYLDFRPVANPTAAYANTSVGATANPSSTLSFSGTNKKFALPGSGVTYNSEYFIGRKDAVVVTSDNRVKVIRGPAKENPDVPAIPKNSLLLNVVSIPPYPCVPDNISVVTSDIINTGVASESVFKNRVANRKITTSLNDASIQVNQPRAYTMSDIAKLDRRISDLEYTVSLSQIESDLKNTVIPSAVSPTLNRFKFGFYADDYSDTSHSDLSHIEYQCSVVSSKVQPIGESILITHGNSYKIGNISKEFALVNQDLASTKIVPVVNTAPSANTPPIVVTPPEPTPNTTPEPVANTPPIVTGPVIVHPTPPTTPTEIITLRNTTVSRNYTNVNYAKIDDFRVTMGSLSGTFTIDYDFGKSNDGFNIYKDTVFGDDPSKTIYTNLLKGKGTLTFNHDPSTGRDYVFRSVKFSDFYSYTLSYPVDSVSYVEPIVPSTTINNVGYNGHLIDILPGQMNPAIIDQNFGNIEFLSQGDKFQVRVAGLKPNTRHNILIVDAAVTASINTITDNNTVRDITLGADGVYSDSSGSASFSLGIDPSTILSRANFGNIFLSGPVSFTNLPEFILVYIYSDDYNSTVGFYVNTGTYNIVNNTLTNAKIENRADAIYVPPLSRASFEDIQNLRFQ